MSSVIEKSADMEKRYEGGIDTWGNRERQLYQKIFKAAVEKIKGYLGESYRITNGVPVYEWVDIGCGGANILDTIVENQDDKHQWSLRGCDLSKVAIEDVKQRYPDGKFFTLDLEEYPDFTDESHQDFTDYLNSADVVSIVDVAYYFGDKRPWKDTMKAIWRSIRPGAIVVVCDSLIPYQRRTYYNTLKDSELLEAYTDYTERVSVEVREDGHEWHRYFKVMIYRKLGR